MRSFNTRRSCATIPNLQGEDIDVELPIYREECTHDIECVLTPHYAILGYLTHDADCENPLESCDAMGHIYHHPNSRYGRRGEDSYYGILGLDSDGEVQVDCDKVQAEWAQRVCDIPGEVFLNNSDFTIDDLITTLKNEEAGEYSIEDMCHAAWHWDFDFEEGEFDKIVEEIEKHLLWDWDDVRRLCAIEPDPDAVILDLYEHGLCRWSVSGHGMTCRWDTSRGEAVWVPDQYLRNELDAINDPQERRYKAIEYAKQACDQYSDWSNGNCFGVVVAAYDRTTGELVEDDACWGFVGDEWAKRSLIEDYMPPIIKHYQEIEDYMPPIIKHYQEIESKQLSFDLTESEGGEL